MDRRHCDEMRMRFSPWHPLDTTRTSSCSSPYGALQNERRGGRQITVHSAIARLAREWRGPPLPDTGLVSKLRSRDPYPRQVEIHGALAEGLPGARHEM